MKMLTIPVTERVYEFARRVIRADGVSEELVAHIVAGQLGALLDTVVLQLDVAQDADAFLRPLGEMKEGTDGAE